MLIYRSLLDCGDAHSIVKPAEVKALAIKETLSSKQSMKRLAMEGERGRKGI